MVTLRGLTSKERGQGSAVGSDGKRQGDEGRKGEERGKGKGKVEFPHFFNSTMILVKTPNQSMQFTSVSVQIVLKAAVAQNLVMLRGLIFSRRIFYSMKTVTYEYRISVWRATFRRRSLTPACK